ncbi:MAG TPA: glucan biosynthesis protein [Devosiaceae bacterium]|nr:glucan biosynthesis protein [Devosiaceae bacterium]
MSAALLGSSALPVHAFAQAAAPAAPAAPAAAPAPAPAAAPATAQFSFDILSQQMKEKAKTDFVPATIQLPDFIAKLGYDEYQHIQFRSDHARWSDDGVLFRVHAFHMGWLFKEPVHLFEVANGIATPMDFTTGDFNYYNPAIDQLAATTPLPGIAGFRLNYPLNRPNFFDELVAFQGASYFRALGKSNNYGLSARGLAINTGTSQPEEFPRFSEFYLEKPAPGSDTVVVNAALDSPSCTGAYRFEITPGAATIMNVTARLFFRKDVTELGIAPLTSMFLFSSYDSEAFEDYRPEVHDSDGLFMHRGDDERLWRCLNNPPALSNSYFDDTNPKAFGLLQRQRDFDAYQDAGAHYEQRPSVLIEPIGEWGKGTIRLVELPSDKEYNDNIVALWRPADPAKAGDSREFSYRLSWGDLPPDPLGKLAFVSSLRMGHGGNAVDKPDPNVRKFVVDFRGGSLAALEDDAKVTAVTTVTGGTILQTAVFKVDANNDWRLVLDVQMGDSKLVELNAHLAGFDQRLTETWLYQWRAA